MKVVSQWAVQENLLVLCLDEEISRYKSYRNYRIDGIIYKPIPMSHTFGKCIAVQGGGSFDGKEVELVD